jgi:hypothetical protein
MKARSRSSIIRRKTIKSKSKTSKVLKGGFYPSIYGGVSTAVYLAPAAAKQAYRLWNSRKFRRRHRSRKA